MREAISRHSADVRPPRLGRLRAGTQRHSEALGGTRRHSEALGGTQWALSGHSVGTQWALSGHLEWALSGHSEGTPRHSEALSGDPQRVGSLSAVLSASCGKQWQHPSQSIAIHRNPSQSIAIHRNPSQSIAIHRNPGHLERRTELGLRAAHLRLGRLELQQRLRQLRLRASLGAQYGASLGARSSRGN